MQSFMFHEFVVSSSKTFVDVRALEKDVPRTRSCPPRCRCGPSTSTTVQLSKVPRRCTMKRFSSALEQMGLLDAVNYVYMPQNHRLGLNKGFAFLNVTDPDVVDQLLTGQCCFELSDATTTEVQVKVARSQGIVPNLDELRAEVKPFPVNVCVKRCGELCEVPLEQALRMYGMA